MHLIEGEMGDDGNVLKQYQQLYAFVKGIASGHFVVLSKTYDSLKTYFCM